MQPVDDTTPHQLSVGIEPNNLAPSIIGSLPGDSKKHKSFRRKVAYGMSAVLLLVAVLLAIVVVIKNSYPVYTEAKPNVVNGFVVATFEDWERQNSDQSVQKTVTFSDYIDSSKKSSNLVHAQQVVVTQTNVVPKNQLTEEVKKNFVSEYTNADTFFKGLGGEVAQCSTLQNKQVTSLPVVELKNAYVVIDFSFSCPGKDALPGIKALGRLLLTTEGSLAVNFIAASEGTYNKNERVLTDAARSIKSQ